MEKFLLENFTDEQKWILNARFQRISYSRICQEWPFSSTDSAGTKIGLTNQNIIACIRRSSLGYSWRKGMKGGSDPYLCPEDMSSLKMLIFSAARDSSPLDTSLAIEKAFELKKNRYAFALEFIIAVNAESLYSEIEEKLNEEKPPVRSWINGVLEELIVSLNTVRYVDILRIISCTPESINQYLDFAFEIIQRFNKYLIFGADETMLFPSIKRKVVLPADVAHEFITSKHTMPHFTAMCTHNLYGEHLANFIILPNLKNLPEELKEFDERGDATFASSKSGWQTRETFLYWTICFINALSIYRRKLPADISQEDALLIMDGHSSRENPFALQLLAKNHIQVLILPSHTSHLLQMFDVAMASPLKRMFSDLFNTEAKKLRSGNMTSKLRFLAIMAFLTSWNSVCNYKNCQAGAAATATSPCNRDVPLSSRFVSPIQERYAEKARVHKEYLEKTFNISSKLMTNPNELDALNAKLIDNSGPEYCLLQDKEMTHEEVMQLISSIEENGSKLLSRFPMYCNDEGTITN